MVDQSKRSTGDEEVNIHIERLTNGFQALSILVFYLVVVVALMIILFILFVDFTIVGVSIATLAIVVYLLGYASEKLFETDDD